MFQRFLFSICSVNLTLLLINPLAIVQDTYLIPEPDREPYGQSEVVLATAHPIRSAKSEWFLCSFFVACCHVMLLANSFAIDIRWRLLRLLLPSHWGCTGRKPQRSGTKKITKITKKWLEISINSKRREVSPKNIINQY